MDFGSIFIVPIELAEILSLGSFVLSLFGKGGFSNVMVWRESIMSPQEIRLTLHSFSRGSSIAFT